MKKLLLVVALFFATSMVFSQRPAPRADCLDCEVTQMDPGTVGAMDNESYITQFGENDANVYQNGNGNLSTIHQSGAMGFLNFGYGNSATVSQMGNSNESDIKQAGDRNIGIVHQYGKMNYAKQDVGVGWAEDNFAMANQRGYKNTSYQKQRNDNNSAMVFQRGHGNYAEQDQVSGANAVAGSRALIVQVGYKNEAEQTQWGSNNDANSHQFGKKNSSVETQTSEAGGSATNESDIFQFNYWYSDGNKACVEQDVANGYWNESLIVQFGSNYASVIQTATAGNNLSEIFQAGKNKACVEQINGGSPL
jgi:hypothetical protein